MLFSDKLGGGGVPLWLQVPGNISALHIPQYRSYDPSIVGGACPERFTELSAFSQFSVCVFFFHFFSFFFLKLWPFRPFVYEFLVSFSQGFAFRS